MGFSLKDKQLFSSGVDPLNLLGAQGSVQAELQKDAAAQATYATIEAAKIAAAAQKEAQDKALAAQKEATEAAVAAAKEAEQKANEAVAKAAVVYEQAMRAGADFSNAEFGKAVEQIGIMYKQAYNANTADFQKTYQTIKNEYAAGFQDVEGKLQPWVDTGAKANERLNALMGFQGEDAARNAAVTDPGYQFRVDQANKALERSAAAGGGLYSGNTLIDLSKQTQNMASDEFTNTFNRLMALSTQGQAGASELSGYRWDLGEKNAVNERVLNAAITGERTNLTAKEAALADYLASTRAANEWQVQNARGQNALNVSNAAAQGAWNVANAQGGGAQNVANVAITGANRIADTDINNAWAMRDAITNQAYGGAAADIYAMNARQEANWNAIDTVASIYGMGKGGGGKGGGGSKPSIGSNWQNYGDDAFTNDRGRNMSLYG